MYASQEAVWLRQLLYEFNQKSVKATVIHEDNQAAICMAKNGQHHGRAKHIDIRCHFIREKVQDGIIELKYCSTDLMLADMLTKGLSSAVFQRLREMTAVVPVPSSSSN